jgi:hypothetical protein
MSKLPPRSFRLGNLFREKVSGLYLGLIDIDKDELGFIPIGQPKIPHSWDEAGVQSSIESFKASSFESDPLPIGWQAERIPLTENFLQRFMFQETGHKEKSYLLTESYLSNTNHRWPMFSIKLKLLSGGGWLLCSSDLNRVFYFVDELQNFFFSLSDQELPNSQF